MKYLVAIALLVLAVAEATHVPEHDLSKPRFKEGKLYKYDVVFNVTAGVLGLSSQVSAAVLKAQVNIYAQTAENLILKIDNAYTSGSVKTVASKYGDIPMTRNHDLEDRLRSPIKFTLESGNITSYTLSKKENLVSRKIKKSILRSLEMYIPESAIETLESDKHNNVPVTYNTTDVTHYGVHTVQYMITASPYPEFPKEERVYNISRIDNFEEERYPSYKLHHNFQKQGCAEVCRDDWTNNKFGAGCPIGHEPHQSPIKTSFSHDQALSIVHDVLTPEVIRTVEVHFAKMYDQDMEVLFRYQLTRTSVSSKSIQEPSGQVEYKDLKDLESEINEKEISDLCEYKKTDELVKSANNLLNSIAKLIVGDLETEGSNLLGEKVILLRETLSRLSSEELQRVKIRLSKDMPRASDEDKVKRQIWLDVLPLLGTHESVKYIVKYITDQKTKDDWLNWEIKEVLEALPQNLVRPTEDDITELRKLKPVSTRSHLLHSSVYLTLTRVIGATCGNIPVTRSQPKQKSSWFENSEDDSYLPVTCPLSLVSDIVKDITSDLKKTRKPAEIAIYIEALSHIGTPDVLPIIAEYIYGNAENLQQFSRKFIDFTKAMSQFALHNMAGKHPDEVLQIVLPLFFNETETPKVRNAAFGVLIRCQPSLDVLQKVVIRSWTEKSNEVGSYVTSTLETFGNSSLPCMQLTARRIKAIFPQLRRFDIGLHHAKNYFWSYFDNLREFGLEGRLEHIPNNESYIPSVIYNSLSYSIDSLRDTIFQNSLHIEGLTQAKIMEKIHDFYQTKTLPRIIEEDEVFGQGEEGMDFLRPRIPDDLRFTSYRKMFYSSSYNYFDSSNMRDAYDEYTNFVRMHLRQKEETYSGHLVKLFLPSSYHTVTIAKTLPYPVEFQMRQPIVLALNVKTPKPNTPSLKKFNLYLKPRVYLSKLFTHQVKILSDCKEIGVYHEHKVAISYPFVIDYKTDNVFPNFTVKYKIPQTQSRVLTYSTGSGTYAAKKELEILPSSFEREPIRTVPRPFTFEKELRVVGLPPFRVQLHTEDMNLLNTRMSRDPVEALDLAVRNILNAGWRQKSVNITLLEDPKLWSQDTEVTFNIRHLRSHISRQSDAEYVHGDEEHRWFSKWGQDSPSHRHPARSVSEEDNDWAKHLKPSTIRDSKTIDTLSEKAKIVSDILSKLPHLKHELNITVTTEPELSSAYFRMEYNHTYEKDLHSINLNADVKHKDNLHYYERSLSHVMGFLNRPDEFDYDAGYGKQEASFITGLSIPIDKQPACPWVKVEIALVGVLNYISNKELLNRELFEEVDEQYFLPETHDQCLSHMRSKQPLSEECVKAIRELSIFNKLEMEAYWSETLPKDFRQFFRRADTYLKHKFFQHLNLTEGEGLKKGICLEVNYIDKLVDEPVIDLQLTKSSETVTLKRVPVGGFRPLSSVYSTLDNYLLEATNNTYPPTCVIMENHVKTYDMKSYPFTPENCYYVLSTHCTQNKNFAVILHGTQEIFIHVGTSTIVLSPEMESGMYVIKFKKSADEAGYKKFTIDKPYLLESENEIYVYTETYGHIHEHLIVIAKGAGIMVTYDTKIIKIQVDPRYKGELCGLCSEFDGEQLREFRGIDRCLYKDHINFAKSTMVKREGNCKVTTFRETRICDTDEFDPARAGGSHINGTHKEYEPSLMRNIVVSKGSEICFSVEPVPVCEDDVTPTETEYQRIGFHCLPKRDITARRMIKEAKWRTLAEIERKSVDYEEYVEIAKMC